MPTVCKITLDGKEYEVALKSITEQTKKGSADVRAAMHGAAQAPGEFADKTAAAADTVGDAMEDAADRVAGAAGKIDKSQDGIARVSRQTAQKFCAGANDMSNGLQKAGGDISKAGGVVNNLSGALGSVAPNLGAVGQGISALVSGPIGILSAAIGAIIALGSSVWNKLTVSAEEYAQKMEHVAKESSAVREELEKTVAVEQQYVARLGEISSGENLANASKQETAQLLAILTSRYGDLGAVIDVATGKLSNFGEVEAKVREKQNKQVTKNLEKEVADLQKQATASYIAFKGSGYTPYLGAGLKALDQGYAKRETNQTGMMSIEKELEYYRKKRDQSTTEEDVAGYQKMVEFKERELKLQEKIANLRNTGYGSEQERAAVLGAKAQRVDQANQSLEQMRASRNERVVQENMNAIEAPEERINMMQRLHRSRGFSVNNIRQEIAELPQETSNMTDIQKLDLKQKRANLDVELQKALDKQFDMELQINAAIRDQNRAKKQLTEASEFELKHQRLLNEGKIKEAATLKLNYDLKQKGLLLTDEEKKKELEKQGALKQLQVDKMIDSGAQDLKNQKLILAGRYEEAEALKLNNQLKQQGLALTDAEKKKLLDQKKALGGTNLRQGLADTARGLKYDAMTKAGQGREAAEEKALYDAKKAKGADLTQKESEMVKRLSGLQYGMANARTSQLGDTEIKTNALTSRGGFAGGAVAPDKDRINKAIQSDVKRMEQLQREIKELLSDVLKG